MNLQLDHSSIFLCKLFAVFGYLDYISIIDGSRYRNRMYGLVPEHFSLFRICVLFLWVAWAIMVILVIGISSCYGDAIAMACVSVIAVVSLQSVWSCTRALFSVQNMCVVSLGCIGNHR